MRIEWRSYVVYIAFAVIFLAFAITQYGNGFLSPYNLLNIVGQTTTISLMAVGMTFVIAAAEIDLSVGNAAGLASVTTALTIQGHVVTHYGHYTDVADLLERAGLKPPQPASSPPPTPRPDTEIPSQ